MISSSMLPIGSLLLLIILCITNNVNGAAVMSVDLGSEWMKVGVISPGVPMEIALNKESKRKTPSAVSFRDGIRTFGEDAQSIGVRFPSSTYFYLLDLLGKTIDNPIVDLYKKRFPYYEIIGDEERNTIVFKNGEQLFRIEELVAQFLKEAKEYAETTTNQPITECVLVVPGYFGQAERIALLSAAQLANLKVLQLINDYTAVALNYGVFRRTEMNETAQYYIFYDMGAQKTSAALVSYQLLKDKTTKELLPTIQILGVGFDRTLGGLEIQLRLRDYLATEFNKMKKTKTNVFENSRAMAKLFKESGRLKNVLSANADHYAQIENLLEDIDFKFQVTREKLEEICSDLWPRVVKPLEQALKSAGLSLDIVNQLILVGGGTRVPKVQDILRDAIKQELGKNINADEAATMGAVYKAADLATGFKVKKFITKDAVILPMQVIFERETSDGNSKYIKRMLFGLMNSYPQKKVITFNKYINDFDFYVNYAELNHLTSDEISYIGSLNISHVQLKKITETLDKHKNEESEPKGIKVHFTLDDSGLFEITSVEMLFEKIQIQDDDNVEGTLSKLGNTISKLFSGDTKETVKTDDQDSNQNETATDDAGEKLNKTSSDEIKQNDTQQQQQQSEKDTESDSKNKTIKTVTIKEPLEYELKELFTKPLSAEEYEKSYKKLDEINTAERYRTRRESLFNALETFVIEARERLADKEYASCATEDEKNKILEECTKVSDWLYEDGSNVDADTYEKRLIELQNLANNVYARHWEHEERPEALKALNSIIEGAQKFLKNAKTMIKEVNPEKDIFTKIEIETLEKAIGDAIEWRKVEIDAQNKLKRYENVRLTVKDISNKMSLLDREVKYLLNKLKIWTPKKPIKKDKTNNKTQTDETSKTTKQTGSESEEGLKLNDTKIDSDKQEDEGHATTTTDSPPIIEKTTTKDKKERESETTTTPHGEL